MTIVRGEPDTFGDPQRAAVVEPDLFRGDGVFASDTVIDHGRVGDLLVRAASVRGTYGRYHGGPREDDYALGRSEDGGWLIVALADGLTSATTSHVAATLAVRTAVMQTQRLLAEDPLDPESSEGPALHGVFKSAAYQLRRSAEPLLEARGVAVTSESIAADFATTLLVALVSAVPGQMAVHLARVGDSNAWSLGEDGWRPLLSCKGTGESIASSAVVALPRLPEVLQQSRVVLDQGETLVLATDGVTDSFGSGKDGPVADYLGQAWRAPLPEPLEFARQLSFRGQSWDDDRTAIAVTRGGARG